MTRRKFFNKAEGKAIKTNSSIGSEACVHGDLHGEIRDRHVYVHTRKLFRRGIEGRRR